MFTGLIEDIGVLAAIDRHAKGAKMSIETNLALHEVKIGDSIAVDGACLTVVTKTDSNFSVDVSLETLKLTTLGKAKTGTRVHLERALCLGDRLGGHLVQGHVDGVGEKVASETVGEGWMVSWTIPEKLLDSVVHKGSITIDGVSLTVAQLKGNRISVALVPHTGKMTTLVDAPIGTSVNIETDLIGKYVHRILTRRGEGGALTLDSLKKAGFA